MGGAASKDGGSELDADGPAGDADAEADGGGPLEGDAQALGNKGRVVSVPPSYVLSNEEYRYRPKANLPEQVSWEIEKGPRGAHVSSDGTEISWTPESDQKGRNELVVSAKLGDRMLRQEGPVTVGVSEELAALDVDDKAGGALIVTAPQSLLNGASVTVRPATLKSASRLSISELDVSPPMTMAKVPPRAVHFGPTGAVFSEPALITLPLADEGTIDKSRVGAFVYDDQGRWVRVPVVAIDTDKRLVHARAAHFSLYAAAQSRLALTVTARAAAANSACAGSAVADITLDEQLSAIDVQQIVNLPASLAALADVAPAGLATLLASPGVSGSFRFVRVAELAQAAGADRVLLESRLLVSTLYLAGDGTATVTHTDALGNVVGAFPFPDVASATSGLWQHLSGRATRAVFSSPFSGSMSVAARLHALYVEGDASLDATSADDLGFAVVDYLPSDAAPLAVETNDKDLDCDGLVKAFDGVDNRLMASIVAEPAGVIGVVAGSSVRLSATLLHASPDEALVWKVLAGNASLQAVAGAPAARQLTAQKPGRYQVSVSAELAGETQEHVFAIDVSAPADLPSCTPSPVRGVGKQDSAIALTAVLSETSLPASALQVQWGMLLGETFSDSAELSARGNDAALTPRNAGQYRIACRATQGSRSGAVGTVTVDVVPPQYNLAPVDLTLSPASTTVLVGEALTLLATGKDPEGQPLRFGWSSSGGTLQTQNDTRSGSRNVFSASTAGFYELRVTIRDQDENPQQVTAFALVVNKATDIQGSDVDKDGWPAPLDCNDADTRVHPGAIDRCGDTIDDDCSGSARQDDCDDDGFTVAQGDCNDQVRNQYPGATELCDGIDNDCQGGVDQGFGVGTSCSVGMGICQASSQWVCASDSFGVICPAKPLKAGLELCDGLDNDCNGAVDEGYVSRPTQCGSGACAGTGITSCVQGVESDSCTSAQASGADATCDGVDNDCNGQIDEDFVRLAEVCNGLDDDCDQSVDEGLACVPATGACAPKGTEICNGLDDDCDGFFDEGGVCGAAPVSGSLLGVFWECANAACTSLDHGGFMFMPGGTALKLDTFSRTAYEPQDGPYCVDEGFQYTVENGVLQVNYLDNGQPQKATGTLTLSGARATVFWTTGPADMLGTMELVRVQEQPGGACPTGPVCQTELCGNGFDDDCDGQPDAVDPDCSAQCGTGSSPEICDLLDNDCNGKVDDLKQACSRPDALGICQKGQLICQAAGTQPSCQPGTPEPTELCADGLDNDCDGSTDEAACSPLSQAETCFNATDITSGGVYTMPKGERNDVEGGCRPSNYVDRVFYINTAAGINAQYSLHLHGSAGLDVGATLYKAPAAFKPGQSCPSFNPMNGMCVGADQQLTQYLDPASTYLLVVEAAPDAATAGGTFRLSVGRSISGICSPVDGDGDGVSICAGDCDDLLNGVHPGGSELCNQQDDDCDGLVDEQDGTCATGLPGVCATGLGQCGQTPACRPIQRSAVDFCGDGVDNDCNGSIDDACVTSAGETCSNAIDVGLGGSFSGTLATASDDVVSRCSAASGAERFYRIDVPAGGRFVTLGRRTYPGNIRYALYRDCTLERIDCAFKGGFLEQGSYRLALESEGIGQAYTFTIGIGDGSTCLTPDVDADGVTACAGDCDESSASVHSGASEGSSCDVVDNDCNGAIDDLQATHCPVAGAQGVCADGELRCQPNGASLCVQTQQPDPQGRDFCGDGLDNDCDGAADSQDPQLCVALAAGDVCSLAQQVDITGGGTFQGSLAGYNDDVQLGCGDNGTSAVERFYAFTLSQPRVVNFQLQSPGAAGDTSFVGMRLLTSCASQQSTYCGSSSISAELPAGPYRIAVFGGGSRTFSLSFSSRAPGDTAGTSCLPADTDGDGVTLCTGDCVEGNASVHPGAAEVCDGIDNDCNGQVDDNLNLGQCDVPGGLGDCALGRLNCVQGALQCLGPKPGSMQEICNDSHDNDCDGMADDQGVPGTDCTALAGDTCGGAQTITANGYFQSSLQGAANDGNGCYGGLGGTAVERYYRFVVPQAGYYYLQVVPQGPGPFPGYAAGIANGSCSPTMNLVGCNASGTNVVWYYLDAPGPHYVVVESDDPIAYRVGLAAVDTSGNCTVPDLDGDGRTLCTFDCNEQNAAVHPGASELCNGTDDNCDGRVDEGC